MRTLVNGENCVCPGRELVITARSSEPIDLSAVLCTSEGRVRGDEDFVFYNQPAAPGVQLADGRLVVRFAEVDPQIEKIVLLASLDGSASGDFGRLTGGLGVEFTCEGQPFAQFSPGGLSQESALALVEVYRRAGEWKLRAVGQGWKDGLAGAARDYGIDVTGQDADPPVMSPSMPPSEPPLVTGPVGTPTAGGGASGSPTLAQQAAPPTARPDRPAETALVSLEKPGASRRISLEKAGPARSLHVNLNWDQGGFLNKIDLDLGCFVETLDGQKTCIQALGKNFGSATAWPWVQLDKDDRSGQAKDGENLVIHRPQEIRRLLIFAMIYAGSRDFTSAKAVVTMTDLHGGVTRVPLIDPPRGGRWCAVAMVTQASGGLEIAREEQYFKGHKEADRRYGFGFRWQAARK